MGEAQDLQRFRLCKVCGKLLDRVLWEDGVSVHMGCESGLKLVQPAQPFGEEHPIRQHLIDLIKWADQNAPRSLQAGIGPSEIGTKCDRRIAMRLAGVRKKNHTTDPWAAIVGTSIHAWLQKCLEMDNQRLVYAGNGKRWITELKVQPDPILTGRVDAYDMQRHTVLDWKTMGDHAERVLSESGPSEGYQTQIQVYGLGFHRLGFPVEKVSLMFLPRAKSLKSAKYFEWPFRPDLAQEAIERVYSIGRTVIQLRRSTGREDIWNDVECNSTELCGWCPFFKRGNEHATSSGCPGR